MALLPAAKSTVTYDFYSCFFILAPTKIPNKEIPARFLKWSENGKRVSDCNGVFHLKRFYTAICEQNHQQQNFAIVDGKIV